MARSLTMMLEGGILLLYVRKKQIETSLTIDVIPSYNKDTIMSKWNSSFFSAHSSIPSFGDAVALSG